LAKIEPNSELMGLSHFVQARSESVRPA